MMNYDRVKMLVEASGAAAVLLGLIFVGLELRQNTEAVEAATFQSLTDASSNFLMTVAADSELTRIYTTGITQPGKLSESDNARFFMVSRAFWVRMQNVFSQWQRGTLSDDDWVLYENVICYTTGTGFNAGDGIISSFKEHEVVLNPDFREFVESCWQAGRVLE